MTPKHDACEVALEILNDLLMYNKIQNGKAELCKEEVGALDFVSKSLKPLAVQIRAKKIQFQLINSEIILYGS